MLNSQLEHAIKNSPFYREHLGDIGELQSLDELKSLPTITAEDIKQHGSRMVCVPGDDISRIVTLHTTGTTGKPKRLFFTRNDLLRTVDFFGEGMGWMCDPGDKVGIFMPCVSPDGIGDLLARGLEKLGAVPLRIGMVQNAMEAAEKLRGENCRVFVGIPWQMRLLCLVAPELRPETVLLSADYLPEAMKSLLEARWGCTVLNHFGMTETGYGGAVENDRHDGMYLRRDELIAEVLDPKTGNPLPYGEIGELALTTLRREAMPLIRCRTGDYARMLDDGRIDRVFGRIGADKSQYKLQEAMTPIRWLYDYSVQNTDMGLDFTFEVSFDAPDNAESQLKKIAEEITGKKIAAAVNRVSPADACALYVAKRIY